jgi:hypothetical protein
MSFLGVTDQVVDWVLGGFVLGAVDGNAAALCERMAKARSRKDIRGEEGKEDCEEEMRFGEMGFAEAGRLSMKEGLSRGWMGFPPESAVARLSRGKVGCNVKLRNNDYGV